MSAAELLDTLAAHGVTLEPRGETLRAHGELTAELRETVKQHKPALLSLLEPKRTITPPGCPEHWQHIPLLPDKHELVTPADEDGNGLRYRVCLFERWYIIRFCPNISATHGEATSSGGKRYAAPSMDSLYRLLWVEAYGDKALFYSSTAVRA